LGKQDFKLCSTHFFSRSINEKEAEKLDLNDRVKRIVSSRVYEFNILASHNSEQELKKDMKWKELIWAAKLIH